MVGGGADDKEAVSGGCRIDGLVCDGNDTKNKVCTFSQWYMPGQLILEKISFYLNTNTIY